MSPIENSWVTVEELKTALKVVGLKGVRSGVIRARFEHGQKTTEGFLEF